MEAAPRIFLLAKSPPLSGSKTRPASSLSAKRREETRTAGVDGAVAAALEAHVFVGEWGRKDVEECFEHARLGKFGIRGLAGVHGLEIGLDVLERRGDDGGFGERLGDNKGRAVKSQEHPPLF